MRIYGLIFREMPAIGKKLILTRNAGRESAGISVYGFRVRECQALSSVTFSSQFTMPNITPMEMRQTLRKTVQATQMGQAL